MALMDELKSFAGDLKPVVPVGAIDINLVDRDENQPRVEFDEARLSELADSIREMGVLEPVLVRKTGDRFTLIAGERRFRASKMVGLSIIPAVVHEDFEDVKRRLVAQIAENIQREDLTDMELGRALARMRDELKMSQREIAKMLGKPDSHISRLISAANPENEGDLGLCSGNAITLERFRALPDDAKEVLRNLGATVSVPDIIKVNNAVKAGVVVTADNIQGVLTSVVEKQEKAPAPQPRHEEESYMTNVSEASEDMNVDNDDQIFKGAEVDETTAASTYRGDTGLDGVASDFRSPTDTGVEDMLLSIAVKLPVTRARELLKLLGGDADMSFDDMPAALSDLFKG